MSSFCSLCTWKVYQSSWPSVRSHFFNEINDNNNKDRYLLSLCHVPGIVLNLLYPLTFSQQSHEDSIFPVLQMRRQRQRGFNYYPGNASKWSSYYLSLDCFKFRDHSRSPVCCFCWDSSKEKQLRPACMFFVSGWLVCVCPHVCTTERIGMGRLRDDSKSRTSCKPLPAPETSF